MKRKIHLLIDMLQVATCRLSGFCIHSNYTFPLTIKGRTWVTCLKCGSEADYDWKNMRLK
jgi:hypothetical protein